MEEIEIGGSKYNKVSLKCGGCVYVEPFDNGEEDDRRKIYDENMNYLDYIDISFEEDFAKAHYYNEILYFKNLEDIHNYLGAVLMSYTCGNTIEELIENVADDKATDYTPEELQEELDTMYEYLEQYGEQQFCTEYLINKVGDYYFCGE